MAVITDTPTISFVDSHLRPLTELLRKATILSTAAADAYSNIGGASAHVGTDTIELPDAMPLTWDEIGTLAGGLAIVKGQGDLHDNLIEKASIRPPTVN